MLEVETEFYRKATSFVKANGSGFVIKSKPEPEETDRNARAANDWICYLERSGLRAVAGSWRAILNRCKALTVPCEKPELFDLSYDPPTVSPPWQGEPHGRRDASRLVRATAAKTGFPREKRRADIHGDEAA